MTRCLLKSLGSCCEGCSLLGQVQRCWRCNAICGRKLRVIRELLAEALLHLAIQHPDLPAKLSEPAAAVTTKPQHC